MTTFLMYHELEQAGRPLCDTDPGYVRYVLDAGRFAGHLSRLAAGGFRGVSVGEACAAGFDSQGRVVMTFDDGCESDLVVAAPLLRACGFTATFYVVSQWIDRRRGCLTRSQVRELHAEGFEVGSHSATHAFLSALPAQALHHEIAGSRRALEDVLGAPVRHLSCPGGRWSPAVARAARDAGYATVATSQPGANGSTADPFALARCAMFRETPAATVEGYCRGVGFGRARARAHVLATARTLLGPRIYAGLRRLAPRSR